MNNQRPARRILRHLGVAALAVACCGALVALSTAPATAAGEAPAVAAKGVVINWNSAQAKFEAPTAEQSARLFAEFQRRLQGGLATRAGLATGPVSTETMPNGMTRAQLPFSLLNLSVIHVAADGSFAESCTQESPAEVDLSAGSQASTFERWEDR